MNGLTLKSLQKVMATFFMQCSNFRSSVHVQQRMNQRGITRDIIDLVLRYGKAQHDCKVTLKRKEAQAILATMQREMKVLKKILDKGGVVVVEDNNTLITTYNYEA